MDQDDAPDPGGRHDRRHAINPFMKNRARAYQSFRLAGRGPRGLEFGFEIDNAAGHLVDTIGGLISHGCTPRARTYASVWTISVRAIS